jgi:hypothetical protein
MGTIKLFNMSLQEAEQARRDRGLDPAGFMTDEFHLDSLSGLLVRGTEVRLDLEHFWSSNLLMNVFVCTLGYTDEQHSALFSVRTNTTPQFRQVNANQLIPDQNMANPHAINYYMPFLFLQDGILETINTFLYVYRVPRSVTLYPDGTVRSAYIVPAFMRSYPFLAVSPVVQMQLLSHEMRHREVTILRNYFPNAGDVFRIQWLVDTEWGDLPHYVRNTIWGQAMNNNGYYDYTLGRARRQNLVNAVNDSFYRFMLSLSPEIGKLSDDNLLKMAILFATFEFNAQISRFGNMVYPRHIAMNELSVGDLFSATILHSSGNYIFYDIDAMAVIRNEHGMSGEIAASITMLVMIVVAFFNNILMGLATLGFAIMIVLAGFLSKNIHKAIMWGVKIWMLLIASNIVGMLLLNMYEWVSYRLALYLMALFMLLFLAGLLFGLKWCFKSVKFFDRSRAASWNPFRSALRQTGFDHYSNQAYAQQDMHSHQGAQQPQQMEDESPQEAMPGGPRQGNNRDYASY